ncbi:MAG: glycoside hydrolase [Bacteroidetes bacterium]|nr:glycoside hydrolase [Bacteroidota bacterium]
MKKIKIILSLLLVVITNQLNAQFLNTIYSDTNILIKETDGFVSGFNNCDNDSGYWALLNDDVLLSHDKDLNNYYTIKIDTTVANMYFRDKYNNKLYSLHSKIGGGYDSVLDLETYKLSTKEYSLKKIYNNKLIYWSKDIFTKNHEFALLINEEDEGKYHTKNPKILILDTLGNIKQSSIINNAYCGNQYLLEMGNYFIFSRCFDKNHLIYLVNKTTLQLVDTLNETFAVAVPINDSILVGAYDSSGYAKINVWNINSKELKTYQFVSDTTLSNGKPTIKWYEHIKFINPDSIFLVYRTIGDMFDNSYRATIGILNFGVNGNLNYNYKFKVFKANADNYLENAIPTEDGGLIIDYTAFSSSGNQGAIIKFLPRDLNYIVSDFSIAINSSCIAYPNPAKDNISFNCSSMINNIDVFNIMGERVYRIDVKDKVKTIDISSFRKGMYIAKLYTERGIIDKKFIVE